MLISVLCPTRNRPQNLHRFVSSLVNNCSLVNNIEFLFYIDDDDVVSEPVLKQFANTRIFKGEKIFPWIQMFNILAEHASGEIFLMDGDDTVMHTPSWDLIVEKELNKIPDNLLVVSTRDGIQDGKIATHSFIHRTWFETLGYIIPPVFPGDWGDNYLTDIARGVDRLVYKPEIYIEHLHPNVGKAPLDSTYTEKFQRTFQYKTEQAYTGPEFERLKASDIHRLQEYINKNAT